MKNLFLILVSFFISHADGHSSKHILKNLALVNAIK